jgi:hypothetical protein
MVRRDLIGPLQEWALASTDPVVRNACAEFATICALLHAMSPVLQEVVAAQLHDAWAADGDRVPKLFAHYLQLSGRFAGLAKALWHWTREPRSAR